MKKITFVCIAVLTALILIGCPDVGVNSDPDPDVEPDPVTEPVTYKITYDGNGNTGGAVPVDGSYETGVTVTVLDNTGNLIKVEDGIDLIFSWNTQADGNGTDYELGSGTFIMGSSDVKLFANWTAIGGEGPAGGLIFYDDEADGVDDISGARYLEAAPVSTEWVDYKWEEGEPLITVQVPVTGTAIGEGSTNTETVADWLDADSLSNMAAQLCRDLTVGSYNDWFLPSKDELTQIYTILKLGNIGDFSADVYWSSSSENSTNTLHLAWSRTFTDGTEHNYMTTNEFSVRAIRAF